MIFAIPSRRACWSNVATRARCGRARTSSRSSTYLGHADIQHTYWYLQATPELMTDIAAARRSADRGGGRMTPLAPLITGFLRDYMPRQRGYSPQSCETYAYSFKLLFAFAAKRTGTRAVAAARSNRLDADADRRLPGSHRAGARQRRGHPQPAARRDQDVHALRRVPGALAPWSRSARSMRSRPSVTTRSSSVI